VLTAAKRSVAAIIDLFPSWQPCETRSYTQKKKEQVIGSIWSFIQELTTIISSCFLKCDDTSSTNLGFLVIPASKQTLIKTE
jgi:hypothetical protein